MIRLLLLWDGHIGTSLWQWVVSPRRLRPHLVSKSDSIQVLANEYNAISLVIGYWTQAVPQWGWILIFWTLFLALSNLGVLAYGEMEFWLSMYVALHSATRMYADFYQHQSPGTHRLLHPRNLHQCRRHRTRCDWVQVLAWPWSFCGFDQWRCQNVRCRWYALCRNGDVSLIATPALVWIDWTNSVGQGWRYCRWILKSTKSRPNCYSPGILENPGLLHWHHVLHWDSTSVQRPPSLGWLLKGSQFAFDHCAHQCWHYPRGAFDQRSYCDQCHIRRERIFIRRIADNAIHVSKRQSPQIYRPDERSWSTMGSVDLLESVRMHSISLPVLQRREDLLCPHHLIWR